LDREEKLRGSIQRGPAWVKPSQPELNWTGEKSSAIHAKGLGGLHRTAPIDLERGVRFVAAFKAARVKPGCRQTEAEAKSFAVHSRMRRGSHRAEVMS
jgi:hypothetical protein